VDKISFTKQTLIAKTHKKYYHVGILKGIVHWLLSISMKAQWTSFCFPPIKLLNPFVLLTDSYSVRCPLHQNCVVLFDIIFISLGMSFQYQSSFKITIIFKNDIALILFYATLILLSCIILMPFWFCFDTIIATSTLMSI
jgi:hypothetical protein